MGYLLVLGTQQNKQQLTIAKDLCNIVPGTNTFDFNFIV